MVTFLNTTLAIDDITNKALPELYNPTEGTSGINLLSSLVSSSIGLIFTVVAIVFIFIIIWGAVQWITSGGDKNGIQAAQGRITNAIVGLVILLSIYAVFWILGEFFGLEIFQNFEIKLDELKIGS